jgi:hypothetical protein
MTARSLRRFVIALLALLVCPHLISQDERATANVQNHNSSRASDSTSTGGVSWIESMARAFQYDYQFLEQPSRVLVQDSAGKTQLFPNPEYNLNQHSFTLDLSQMFAASDFDTARKNGTHIPPWKSFLNGIVLKGQLAEHTRVVQQTLLPSGGFAKNYNVGGEADFDPSKVFKEYSTSKDRPTPRNYWLEAVPKISFKRVTPFDLVKYGGGLVPQSTQNGLSTIEMTWDARRMLRPQRVVPQAKPAADEKICVIWFLTSKSYIGLPKEENSRSCQHIAESLGNKPFQLGCSSTEGATWGKTVRVGEPINSVAIPDKNECHWDF